MQPKVFISSKLQELKEEREIVEKAVFELWNNERLPFTSWRWEERAKDIPSGKHPDEVQSEKLRDSDIYVLILSSEYGEVEYGKSPTHKEYDIACSKFEKDCILIYIQDVGRREEKLEKWIEEIKKKHTLKPFKNSDELKNLVKTRLTGLWEEKKWKKELDDDEKLPDIRVEVTHVYMVDMAGGNYGRYFINLKIKNHDKNSISLVYPKITIQNSKNYIPILRDSLTHKLVPTGELKSGRSWNIYVDPNDYGAENIDQLENVIFPDEIGREFKGSAEDTLNAIKAWKDANNPPLPGFPTDGRIPKM